MKKTTFLLAILLVVSFSYCNVSARELTTHLAEGHAFNIPPELTIIPAVPKMRLLPKPGPKPYKTDSFEKAQVVSKTGFWLKPGTSSKRGKEVLNYLYSSKELIDSIKLRHIARNIKYNFLKKLSNDGIGGKGGLSISSKYVKWYKETMNLPIPVLIDVGFGSGPAMAPVPSGMKMKGKIAKMFKPIFDGKEMFFSTFMLIEDIPNAFSVSDAIKNDTLDLVFCHENAHGIMFDMYGAYMDRVQKLSNIGHDSHLISDRGLAYIEGWAECFEALYGPSNPLLKLKPKDRKKYRISEFLFGRQDPIRRQRYIWSTLKKKTGILKTGQQIVSTEGVVAGVFYDIISSKSLKTPFEKAVSVMYYYKPLDIVEFILDWVKMYPSDKRVMLRVFLENTNYATCSNKVRKLYHDYYQAKLKFVKKEMPKAAFYKIKKEWFNFKEELFKKAMADVNIISSNIGKDQWVELGPNNKYKGLRVNLNTATFGFLTGLLGMDEANAQKLIQTRSSLGYLKGSSAFASLRTIMGASAANSLISQKGLKELKPNPINSRNQGWLGIIHNVPQSVYDKLAKEQENDKE